MIQENEWVCFPNRLQKLLPLVQKPGRYTGGELNSVMKEKDEVEIRFAFCFPDTYEIGMSFLGEKILYELLNRHETGGASEPLCPGWT